MTFKRFSGLCYSLLSISTLATLSACSKPAEVCVAPQTVTGLRSLAAQAAASEKPLEWADVDLSAAVTAHLVSVQDVTFNDMDREREIISCRGLFQVELSEENRRTAAKEIRRLARRMDDNVAQLADGPVKIPVEFTRQSSADGDGYVYRITTGEPDIGRMLLVAATVYDGSFAPKDAQRSDHAARSSVRQASMKEQMRTAFRAAFGRDGSATFGEDPEQITYKPAGLIWIGDTAALLSEGTAGEYHAAVGTLAVHYLKATGDKFEVVGAWPKLLRGSDRGQPPEWTISQKISDRPAIVTKLGGFAMACGINFMDIAVLEEAGPKIVAEGILTQFGDGSPYAAEDPGPDAVEGRLIPGKLGEYFTVTYSGDVNGTVKYQNDGAKFVATNPISNLPDGC